MSSYSAFPLWFADKIFGNGIRGAMVGVANKKWQPQILHSPELQNAGYSASVAIMHNKPAGLRFIATNWVSDIFWFRRFDSHLRKLTNLSIQADEYSRECQRHVE
jgi:hypothetical protein